MAKSSSSTKSSAPIVSNVPAGKTVVTSGGVVSNVPKGTTVVTSKPTTSKIPITTQVPAGKTVALSKAPTTTQKGFSSSSSTSPSSFSSSNTLLGSAPAPMFSTSSSITGAPSQLYSYSPASTAIPARTSTPNYQSSVQSTLAMRNEEKKRKQQATGLTTPVVDASSIGAQSKMDFGFEPTYDTAAKINTSMPDYAQVNETQNQNIDLSNFTFNPEDSRAIYDKNLAESGAKDYGSILSDTRNRLARLQRDVELEKRALDAEPISAGAKAGRQNEIDRKYAYELADLAIAEAAFSNRYDQAMQYAEMRSKLEIEDQQNDLNRRVANYYANYDKLTEQQRKIVEGNLTAYGAKIQQSSDNADILNSQKSSLIKAINEGADLIPGVDRAQQVQMIAQAKSLNELPSVPVGSGLSQAQINSTVNTIAGAFDNEPIVKEFNVINGYVNTFNSLGNEATDDQARIYAFAKVMDPNSVVRESEYKTVQDYSQALLKSKGINIKRIFTTTGSLTQEARDAMSKTLQTKLNVQKSLYDNVASEYQRQINDAYAGKNRQITNYTGGSQSTGTGGTIIKTSVGDVQPNW